MPLDYEVEQKMDQAAARAEDDLRKLMSEDLHTQAIVIKIAIIWKKYFMSAGHKRLGRVIASLATNR